MNPTGTRRFATLALGLVTAGVLVAASHAKDEVTTADRQVKVESIAAPTRAEVGKNAPDFTLVDTAGQTHSLADYQGKVVVLEWFNPDCPLVKKHHEMSRSMRETYESARKAGAVWLAINSGAPGKQGAGVERNVAARESYGMEYPVLLDEEGTVGKSYGARNTPHMFVIAADGALMYQGAIDDNPSLKKLGELNYVLAALHAIQSGKPVETANTKSYGCSVKYAS